jgi:GST-like protein
MLTLYYAPAPNPRKVVLFLEEAQLPYRLVPVDTRKGEQHSDSFKTLNPNAKTPVIDDDGTVVFDSNAILLYLAEKTGKFLPQDPARRGELLSWLMFVATGLGPYNGQAVHFGRAAPERIPYAVNRYRKEAARHFGILEARLATRAWLVGDAYSIVDMAAWGWTNPLTFVLGDEVTIDAFPNLARWHATINARPAAERAAKVGTDIAWKSEMDEAAQRALFPQNY